MQSQSQPAGCAAAADYLKNVECVVTPVTGGKLRSIKESGIAAGQTRWERPRVGAAAAAIPGHPVARTAPSGLDIGARRC